MAGESKYSGNPRRAARLAAARLHAGYATAREAAQHFGWPEPRYRSHEGAIRDMNADTLKDYARAYGVSVKWLGGDDPVEGEEPADGEEVADSKIVVDQLRERQLELRVMAQRRPAEGDDAFRAQRLRLARRLAGFPTPAAAAKAMDLHRTTVSSAERGLFAFDIGQARIYAAVYGCEPVWLLEGNPPSGYPPAIEDRLPELLATYDKNDEEALPLMPTFTPPARTTAAEPPIDPRATPTSAGETLPEYEIEGLARLMRKPDSAARPATMRGWSMPAAFLEGVLRADPAGCVVVAVPRQTRTGGFSVAPGDRLIVDASVREIFSAVYAVLVGEELVIADARTNEGKAFALKATRGASPKTILLGQIVGSVAALR
ncbi:helix-turn-helix transcriptional regulator [Bradyrhizobium sp. UFLA01-814]|uniref:helix-turn-helix domain-containing protein n=1 Tax=Bradyrhizobium sp. UFLA01-814 TaxID=3023480 RepID=UPI00398BA48E